jgi:hypothetical protein
MAVIILNEGKLKVDIRKGLGIPAFHEKATVITKDCGLNNQWTGNVALDDVHVSAHTDIEVW